MWRRLLELLRDAGRPLVFVDFETAGLSGAPPVSFAVLVFQLGDEVDDGETTQACLGTCPEGLVYAVTKRLDPLCQVPEAASRVHGIYTADVRGKEQAYNDFEVSGFFRDLASGDGGGRPAVFAGHNVCGADIPWMLLWGYLAEWPTGAIDTMRVGRRLVAEHPYPLVPERTAGPCREHGLDAFSGSLTGQHVAVCGGRPSGAHDALGDVCASARLLAGLLEGWAPLWESSTKRLDLLLSELDKPPSHSWDGWLREETGGWFSWAKGKHRDKPVSWDMSYAEWVSKLPREPTGVDGNAWCSHRTAEVLGMSKPPAPMPPAPISAKSKGRR